ncbi:uncharacterized protein L201_007709 [Kwoniella dendrophila CBS 6074]|uniref:VWFA domain-containing protein n=1 Tax=Kwoniella dendrophila CBS 6074 TaxID=1295534 RepID=A0AAX4K7G7_9TREE
MSNASAQYMRQNRQMYNLGPMLTSSNVYWALANRQYTSDPEYVKAVIRNYAHFKAQRGKNKIELSLKLEVLEREFPHYAYAFRAIRTEYGLNPSRVLPLASTSATTNPLRRAQTASSSTPTRTTASPITRTHTTVGATTTRPVQNNDEEPPPPPYASQDPDPSSTRILQESLAAEAELRGTLASQTADTPTSATTSNANTSQISSPAAAASSQSSHQQEPARSLADEGPQRIPSDPELARVWEESQLEEAKRASLAYQAEQDELQEAMRLSLAEIESRGEGSSSVTHDTAGSSRHHISPISENRPVEGDSNDFEIRDLVSGMEDMMIPGSYGGNPSTSSLSASTSNTTNPSGGQVHDILDEQPPTFTGQTPLTPQKTGLHIQSKNPFLSSNEKEQLQAMEEAALTTPTSEHFRTPSFSTPNSTHMQFAPPSGPSPNVHNEQAYPSNAEAGSSHTFYSPPLNNDATETYTHQQTPPAAVRHGSGHTHYTPPSASMPSEPSQQIYTPPTGPPPSHLRIVTPTSPTSRPLPATPKNELVREQSSSPRIAFPQPQPVSSPIAQTSLSSPIADSHNNLHQIIQQGIPPPLPARRKSTFVPPPGKEDALDMLRDFDTVFLVDDSTSMAGERWSEARQALMEVAEIAARYDENGVDIYFLNSKRVGKELKAAPEVEDLFRGLEPKGATPTGMRLESILREYMSKLERSQTASPTSGTLSDASVKPMNLIVVTDGAPTDDPESVLIACAKRLDRGEYPLSQVGVQFLQIGNDSEAREALQELDDGLSSVHGIRDIVDTVLYNGEDMSAGLIIKTLLGGINRRLDRRSSA